MTNHALEESMDQLRQAAMEACANAHAPYSQFAVGCATLSESGQIFAGCNVENASYGQTICAERNALAHAVARGVRPGQMNAMLIYTPGNVAHAPCGACRQVMHEFLAESAVITSCCDGDERTTWTMRQLMPDPFQF